LGGGFFSSFLVSIPAFAHTFPRFFEEVLLLSDGAAIPASDFLSRVLCSGRGSALMWFFFLRSFLFASLRAAFQ